MEEFISWAITRRESGKLIGQINMGPFAEEEGKEIGIGYWMGMCDTGLGYTTEAAKAVTEFAFYEFSV